MDNNQINPQELLEKLLTASKDLASKGKNYAENALNIPDEGAEREQKIEGLKKGAIASALLFGLLGTKGGRSITGKAIKIGSLAALGTAAYKGYKHWQSNINEQSANENSINDLNESNTQARSLLIIAAMISAANADGKLDDQESDIIKNKILDMKLPEDLLGDIKKIKENPLSVDELCQQVKGDIEASEVYLASRIMLDSNGSEQEQLYLQTLINGLGLSEELVQSLDSQLA